jgi:hypothetical protein
MPSSTFPSEPAPAAPSLAIFQLYKKLPLRLRDPAYRFLLTGQWTAESPDLINALKQEDERVYIAALGIMTHTYDYVLSPRNNYQVDRYPQAALKDVKKVRIEFK